MQPENLLLGSHGDYTVSDFGLSSLPQQVTLACFLFVALQDASYAVLLFASLSYLPKHMDREEDYFTQSVEPQTMLQWNTR